MQRIIGLALAGFVVPALSVGIAEEIESPEARWPFTTVVLNLDGTGIKIGGAVAFDLDADGEAEMVKWPEKGTAFLVMDLNGNRTIDDGSELFSNVTPSAFDGKPAQSGFVALADFDLKAVNGDIEKVLTPRVLDENDPVWPALRLWEDSNRDGVSQEWELTTLHDAGLIALDYDYEVAVGFKSCETPFESQAWRAGREAGQRLPVAMHGVVLRGPLAKEGSGSVE